VASGSVIVGGVEDRLPLVQFSFWYSYYYISIYAMKRYMVFVRFVGFVGINSVRFYSSVSVGENENDSKDLVVSMASDVSEVSDVRSNFELNKALVDFDVTDCRVMGVLDGFVNAGSSIEVLNEYYQEITSYNKEGFIKSSDPSDLPILGVLWKEMGFDGLELSESYKRFVINSLYDVILLHLIDSIQGKLARTDEVSDEVHDLRALLKVLLFKLNPGVRRLLLGMNFNIFYRIYAGYDTEFQTVEYGENKLISYQLAVTGRALIKVNNVPSLYDFERVLVSSGEVYELDGLKDDPKLLELLKVINVYLLRNKPIDSMKVKLLNILCGLTESGGLVMERDGDTLIFTRNVMGSDKFGKRATHFVDMRGVSSLSMSDILSEIRRLSDEILHSDLEELMGMIGDCGVSEVDSNFISADYSNVAGDMTSVVRFGDLVKGWDKSRMDLLLKTTRHFELFFVSHFGIADLSLLSDYGSFKNKIDSIQGTHVTVGRPMRYNNYTIYFRDSMLLAPAGKASLKALGDLHGFPKIDIGNWINSMNDLIDKDPELFKVYALRDAEISLIHILSLESFYFELTGSLKVPATLASLASSFIKRFWESRGVKGLSTRGKFMLGDVVSMMTPKNLNFSGDIAFILPYFIGSYKGGRNESFAYGLDRGRMWYDYDLVSAYTTAMSLMRFPDYSKVTRFTSSMSISDLVTRFNLVDSFSAFKVLFRFDSSVRFPCIPVHLDDSSIVFPLEGEAFVNGPELLVAYNNGAIIEVLEGVIIPFVDVSSSLDLDQVYPFRSIIGFLQKERSKYPAGSLNNLLFKTLGNSLYGQTARGIGQVRHLDTRKGTVNVMSVSSLTNPLMASWITSFIRGVLSELLMEVHSMGGILISCTTDGFITNLPNLDKNAGLNKGSLCYYFRTARKALGFGFDLLELKHSTKGICSWSTRGQLGLDSGSGPSLRAMTGFQSKYYSQSELVKLIVSHMERGDLDITYMQQSLRKVNEIYRYGGSVTPSFTEKTFRLLYDNRRAIDLSLSDSDSLFLSRPHKNVEECKTYRFISKLGSNKYAMGTPFTIVDGKCKYIDIAVRMFIRAYTQSKLGLVSMFSSYQELSDFIYKISGKRVSCDYIASQKRRPFIKNSVPRVPSTLKFVESVKVYFSDFDEGSFFKSS
jgi:hypothetical protein